MIVICWFLLLVVSVRSWRDIEFKNCKHISGTPNCKVKSVEVNGCLNPTSWVDIDGSVVDYKPGGTKNPCRIEKGSTLNFSITFEPGFEGSSLRGHFSLPELGACWEADRSLCPVQSPQEQGCEYTKCPLQRGRSQRYETTLQVSREVPSHSINDRKIYQMKWKLWNNKNKRNNCCFNIPIQY